MQVTPNRPVAAVRPAKATVAAAPTTDTTSAAKPRTPQVVAQAQGPRAKLGMTGGAIGGGLVGGLGIGVPALFINWLSGGTLLAGGMLTFGLVLAGAIAVGASVGAGIGWLQGTVEDKVLDKVAKNPNSQWGFYVSGYGVLHTAGALLKGAATGMNGAFTGIGSALGGVWQTAVEVKGLKEGGELTDNKIRLAGAAAATVGGGVAALGLVPAVATAVPLLVPIGVGVALLGWGANLVGQFMNERRNEK